MRRMAMKVGEHHGDLAALGSLLWLPFGHGGRLRRGPSITGKLGDRAQHLSAITKDNTELFQVLIRQVAKDGDINTVLGESLNVLGHAELFEPVCCREGVSASPPTAAVGDEMPVLRLRANVRTSELSSCDPAQSAVQAARSQRSPAASSSHLYRRRSKMQNWYVTGARPRDWIIG